MILVTTAGKVGSSTGKGRMGMIDARDVAAVAVEIATSSASHVGKTYKLTGPALITYSDVAATLSKILGRPINYHELSSEEDKSAMIQAGFPKEVAEMNAQFFKMVAGGDSGWLSEDVPFLLGHQARSFEAFATDYASAFS
jgi:uncharacterized protein YbjT (DUF2867 family)